MEINVLEWLEKTAAQNADKTAFTDSDGSITFGEIRSSAESVGSAVLNCGITGKPVAVITGRHRFTPAAFFGVVYSGCFYAPIDGSLPVERINRILEILSPELILVDRQNTGLLEKLCCRAGVLILEDVIDFKPDRNRLDGIRRFANENDPLYVIFTSGSTGKPKGVVTSHHSLMCYIDAYASVMGIDETDVLGNQSPLDYIAAIRDLYLPLRFGCSTVIIPKNYFSSPANLFDFMTEQKVTSVGWSVSALTIPVKLNAFGHGRPEYLKKVCFSGSVMPCSCLKVWQKNLPDTLFVNQYGPTEATASCTYYKVENQVDDTDVLPIGLPYRDYRVFIVDENLQPVENGREGEICVSGPILALGYYNDPERTADAFIVNPCNKAYRELMYRTGDIGVRRDDGIIEFHGRKDRQIKHLGHRVELDEVEIAVGNIEGVTENSVVYNRETETIWLFYTGTATAREIATGLRTGLPGFMVPRKMKNLDEIPKLPNGKINLRALEDLTK